MARHNSLIDLYRSMFIASLSDVASASTYPNAELSRDIQTVECRVEAEGLSFLTKTIPSFAKAIDYALATATCVRFRGFKLKRGTQLPLFLGWLLRQVFDDVGDERSDASIEALTWLRQVGTMMYKLGVPTTEYQNEQVINSFISTDSALPELDSSTGLWPAERVQIEDALETCPFSKWMRSVSHRHDLPHLYLGRRVNRSTHDGLHPGSDGESQRRSGCGVDPNGSTGGTGLSPESVYAESVLTLARLVVCRVVGYTDPRAANCCPRHGPGAVAGGERGADKMSFKTFFQRLDRMYSFTEYFCFNALHAGSLFEDFQAWESKETGTAKVVLVPKDSRGPRLISMEPKELQWIQQGVRRLLEKAITSSRLSGGQVNFNDQTINRKLALAASSGAPWVTLDMKDASDRVSSALVKRLFPDYWFECMYACRSDSTRLPSGEVIPLRKFAPMGSSLCFPVESLTFWALSVAAIMHKHPLLDVFQASKRVYVYGDDLIVRVEDQDVVLQSLPLFHLKFNSKKCCTAGFFRESCGCDAYKGVDVTPLKIKCVWDHRSGKSLVQHVALHNAACDKGMFGLADLIFDLVSKVRKFPYSENKEASYVCWVDPRMNSASIREYNSRFFKRRFGSPRSRNNFHRREIFTTVVQARSSRADLPGYSEMLRIASLRGLDERSSHPLVKVAPADDREFLCLHPSQWNFDTFLGDEPAATAYLYTSRREVSLKRRWCPE